jgi:hypothetical protein
MAGGVNAISISSANINSNAVVTIRTTVNHGITTLTQSKLLVSTNQVSLNSDNYSADYAQFGFDIRAVPTPNTISFVLPNDSFKNTSPGDRTIKSIQRFSNGVVQVETNGPHLYSNGDLVYASGVGHVFADFYISSGSVARVINPTTLTYTQNSYATVTRSLVGATAFIYTPILEPNKSNDYFFGLQAADPVFNGFYPGDTITYVGLPETIVDGFNNNAYSPSYFNGNHDIYLNGGVQINQAGTKTVLIKAGEMRDFEIGRYLYPVTNPYIISQGSVKISFEEVGKVNNNSQLCPVLQTSVIDGYIISTIPTGISLKNGSKLVYVLDNIIFVGNTTIGNIVDSKGSRAFRPDTVTIEAPTFTITPNKYFVSEGDSVTFNITTTNFGSGTLYWTNIGTTIGADFNNGLNSGSINIENDSGTFTLNLANDLLLEGPQSIQIELRTGSTSGPIVSTTFIISVNDTSFPPTYKITPDKTNMNEGQTVTYQVETTGVASGTTLYWTNDGAGVTTTGPDFTDGYNSGNFIINSGVGTFSRSVSNDLFVDQSGINTESIKMRLRTVSTSGTVVASAASVTVFDSSVPYYNVVASPTSLNEGGAVLFTVTAYGIAQGTTLYWSNEGTTTAADFNENKNNGELVIGAGNTASVALTMKNDLLLEGTETIVFQLRNGSVTGTPINAVSPYNTSATVTVNDTSVPTYSVTSNATYNSSTSRYEINEGSTVRFTITTTGISDGTTLYWSNEGITSAADFANKLNAGSFTVTNNVGYVDLTLVNDLAIEGTESISLRVRTGSITGNLTNGLSPPIYVLDTSTPSTLFRINSIIASPLAVNEGQSITFTINFIPNTVPNGSYLYWYNSGTTSARDFSDGLNSDIFIVNNNTATITRTLLNDYLTENTETIVFEIHADSFDGPLLGLSTVIVSDVSFGSYSIAVSGNYFYNETNNNSVTFYITTTNVTPGTKLYWDIPYIQPSSTVTAADFTDGIVSGEITLASPVAQSAALQFNGTNQYLKASYNSAQRIASDNFSIEAWIYPTSTPGTSEGYGIFNNSIGIPGEFNLRMNQNLYLFFYTCTGTYTTASLTGSTRQVVLNTWNHVAVVRNNGVIKLYVNGIADSSVLNYNGAITSYAGFDNPIIIGYDTGLTGLYFQGYISNVRFIINSVSSGASAIYTSNFSPPTSTLSKIDGNGSRTVLLACQSDFNDYSSYALQITNYGNVTISPQSPYIQATASITKTFVADRLTDNIEKMQFRLLNAPNSTVLASTSSLTIDDSSPFIEYQFTNNTYTNNLINTNPSALFTGTITANYGVPFYVIGPINGSINLVLKSWANEIDVTNTLVPTYNKAGYLATKTITIPLNAAGQYYYSGSGFLNTLVNRGSSANTYISADLVTSDGKFKSRYPRSITYRYY